MVGAHPASGARLAQVLVTGGARLTVASCSDEPLLASALAQRVIPVTSHGTCTRFTDALVDQPDVLDTLPDWIIWCTDMDLLRMSRSALPLQARLRLLPARNEDGLTILGSKVGLARLAARIDVPQPLFAIANGPKDLTDALAAVGGPAVIKGERGAGGERILGPFPVPLPVPPAAHQRPHTTWYPVLVQRFQPGPTIGAEALFVRGRLAGLLHGPSLRTVTRFGPALSRRFGQPAEGIVSALQRLGQAAALHGFANCTFVSSPDGPLLIEADMRPNAWHQFGPLLGVDWARLMRDPPAEPVVPGRGQGGQTVHLYPRAVVHAIRARSWTDLRPWLLHEPGTWQTRVSGDRALDRSEAGEIVGEIIRLGKRGVSRLAVTARNLPPGPPRR